MTQRQRDSQQPMSMSARAFALDVQLAQTTDRDSAHPALLPWLAVAVACLLDRLIGDRRLAAFVQVMGGGSPLLRQRAEAWAGDQAWRLRLAGGA